MKHIPKIFLILAALCSATTRLSASDSQSAFAWRLASWLSPPPVPKNNPMDEAKVTLGRHLFFDIRLSGPGYMSCATCHEPQRAFTDGRRVAIGVTGQRHTRNTPSLANVGYMRTLTWADPKPQSLEVQMKRPMFSEAPVEMGIAGHEVPVLSHIQSNAVYQQLFARAFPKAAPRISFKTIRLAIAAFQRTIVSGTSPYDRYRFADATEALSPAARRGAQLFNSSRLKCSACHSGLHLTDSIPVAKFHNTGLYNTDGAGGLPSSDIGLAAHTGRASDRGKFRTPSLRNVAVTAPYMHDGSVATLADVIDHYAAGGRAAQSGAASPLRSKQIVGFEISAAERKDLIAFLESLTDDAFLKAKHLQSPFQ